MKNIDNPIKILIDGSKKILDCKEVNIERYIRKGHKNLSIKEKDSENKKYNKELPKELLRKIRRLKNITLDTISTNKNYTNEFIILYDMLLSGIEDDKSIDEETLEKLKSHMKKCKEEVENYKIKIEMENISMKRNMYDGTKVVFLADKICNGIEECKHSSIHDADDIYALEKYNKYAAIKRSALFRIKNGDGELVFEVLCDDIENITYLSMIGEIIEAQVLEFDNTKSAIKFILDIINKEELELSNEEESYQISYECFNGNIETETVYYDTITSFGEKIDYLLS